MAALIGRVLRSAFTHVLRDVSYVSPRIQSSNSMKISVYIDYVFCYMNKKVNGKINSFLPYQFEFPSMLLSWFVTNEHFCSTVYRKLLKELILQVFFSSGGHPCTRWMFDKNANSLQAGRSLSSSPHSLYANKPTTDTTTEKSDEVQIQ